MIMITFTFWLFFVKEDKAGMSKGLKVFLSTSLLQGATFSSRKIEQMTFFEQSILDENFPK